jgi:aldose sugar dehydrogenase
MPLPIKVGKAGFFLARLLPAALLLITPQALESQAPRPPSERDFLAENVASRLPSPWAIAFPSGEKALVTLRGGGIEAIDLATGARSALSGLPRIESPGQGGLLDLVLAPDFSSSREVFLSFSEGRSGRFGTSIARARFLEAPDRLADWKVIFSGNNRAAGGLHFGSRLAFDRQGYLLATFGERNERNRARDPRDHGGKTLRLDRDGKPAPGNPFADGSAAPEIYTIGHRNPQGLAIHPDTGQAWLHEHGPQGGDEVNILAAGSDYGWPVATYGREYSGAPVGAGATTAPGTVQPLVYWVPSIAPSGMAFYVGSAFPSWRGDLLVGALAGMELRRLDLEGGRVIAQTSYLKGWARIRDVRVGPDGLVYLLTDGEDGGLWRLRPR